MFLWLQNIRIDIDRSSLQYSIEVNFLAELPFNNESFHQNATKRFSKSEKQDCLV